MVDVSEITLDNGIHLEVFAGLVGVNLGPGNPTTADFRGSIKP